MQVTVISPEASMFDGEADAVVAPAFDGEVGILPNHAPFMTALREGPVTVHIGANRRVFSVKGGFADVTPQGLTILAEEASEAGAA